MSGPKRIQTVGFARFRCGGPGNRATVSAQIGAILQQYGFVSLIGHGLPRTAIDDAFFAAEAFFGLPGAAKGHYAPQEAIAATSDFGVSAHVDPGLLTLLVQDERGGLSVAAPDGDWLPVVPDASAVVVNVGALLRRWTNGRYAAATHRVINASGRERYSIPLFMHPCYHTRIDPRTLVAEPPAAPEFEPVVAGQEVLASFMKERPSWTRTEAAETPVERQCHP